MLYSQPLSPLKLGLISSDSELIKFFEFESKKYQEKIELVLFQYEAGYHGIDNQRGHVDNLVILCEDLNEVEKFQNCIQNAIKNEALRDLKQIFVFIKVKGLFNLLIYKIDDAKNNIQISETIICPLIFGPFFDSNNKIAVYCHQILQNKSDGLIEDKDREIESIYIGDFTNRFYAGLLVQEFNVENLFQDKVNLVLDEVIKKLNSFNITYIKNRIIPKFESQFDLNLFNTFRHFEDIGNIFPLHLINHQDERGTFVETIKLESGGQVSFSVTKPGITRGNHFHTRKIERFAVIKGEARIQLRQIGRNEVFNFELSGNAPSFVDMPIYYTHNIKNIGEEDLYTIFWINEFYDSNDPDTFFETV